MAILANMVIDVESGLIGGSVGTQGVEHHVDPVGGQLLFVKQLGFAELGHVGEDRHFGRQLELVVLGKLGHRLGEDHVGTGGHIGSGALKSRLHPLHRQCIGAGHDDELAILAGIHCCLDAIAHLLKRDHRLVGAMTTTLLGHLIFHMDGGNSGPLERANGAGDIECPAPAGVDINQ